MASVCCIMHIVELFFDLWSQTFSTKYVIFWDFQFQSCSENFRPNMHPISSSFFILDWPSYRSYFPFPGSTLVNQPFISLYTSFLLQALDSQQLPCGLGVYISKELRFMFGFPYVQIPPLPVLPVPSNPDAHHTNSLLKIQNLAEVLPQPVGLAEEVPDICPQEIYNLVRTRQHWGSLRFSLDTVSPWTPSSMSMIAS